MTNYSFGGGPSLEMTAPRTITGDAVVSSQDKKRHKTPFNQRYEEDPLNRTTVGPLNLSRLRNYQASNYILDNPSTMRSTAYRFTNRDTVSVLGGPAYMSELLSPTAAAAVGVHAGFKQAHSALSNISPIGSSKKKAVHDKIYYSSKSNSNSNRHLDVEMLPDIGGGDQQRSAFQEKLAKVVNKAKVKVNVKGYLETKAHAHEVLEKLKERMRVEDARANQP